MSKTESTRLIVCLMLLSLPAHAWDTITSISLGNTVTVEDHITFIIEKAFSTYTVTKNDVGEKKQIAIQCSDGDQHVYRNQKEDEVLDINAICQVWK